MTQIDALEKLASTGLLKHEPPGREEIAGLIRSAAIRLDDACKTTNAPESRFDLAYNAAPSLAVAALRIHGYRTDRPAVCVSIHSLRRPIYNAWNYGVTFDAAGGRINSPAESGGIRESVNRAFSSGVNPYLSPAAKLYPSGTQLDN